MDELQLLQKQNTELETALQEAQRRLDDHQREMALIRQFDREIAHGEKLAFILNQTITWLPPLLNVDSSLIALWEVDRHTLEAMISTGKPLGEARRPHQPIVFPDGLMPPLEADPQVICSNNQLIADLRRSDNKLLGVLLLERTQKPDPFTPEEQRFVRLCADRLAVAMHHAILIERVQSLSHYRAQLFRLLSHDLRQPLTVLKGYTDLLQLADRTQNYAVMGEYLEHIARGTRDLSDLLEEVLLKEQLDNPSRSDWIDVSMRDLCEKALEKYLPMAQLKKHNLTVSTPKDDPIMRQGLTLQLKEAMGNLISNAIKYTPDEGEIQVSLWVENNRIYFEVRDNGYGISARGQERLFEIFYRAQEPGTENIKGTGMGLNLVKGIIENHDGEVYFSSERHQGSTFGFWLPIE